MWIASIWVFEWVCERRCVHECKQDAEGEEERGAGGEMHCAWSVGFSRITMVSLYMFYSLSGSRAGEYPTEVSEPAQMFCGCLIVNMQAIVPTSKSTYSPANRQ